ncbi:DUF6215 domain-containing protein [Streptomyces sp. NBC_01751]|uniref:DUF6215 domain-containing protein n=1 Tax=Streptomyces sp. NBC_01751 TaxID=2975929 RepID=UPI002DD87781|nr:DUF6215 domain-containing protein [Streptomyces sp. NBC_01751]WSD29506.1 DUF6215 domain-containing protein [Streptomyces sp. NBC_01751]
MADDIDAPAKGAGAWGQGVAAVALVAVLGVGLWTLGETSSSNTELPPARCSGGEPEKASGELGKVPRRLSGAQLCEALNRPDLAELLGTPGEIAKTAGGSGGSVKLAGGKEIATPSARVEFGTYTVTLSATYDRFSVAGSAALLGGGARQRTVGFVGESRGQLLVGSDSSAVGGALMSVSFDSTGGLVVGVSGCIG